MSEELQVTEDGVDIPESLRGYEGSIVIRTPTTTIDMKGGTLDALCSMVQPRHFDVENHRAGHRNHKYVDEDEIGFKRYGEAVQTYPVTVE